MIKTPPSSQPRPSTASRGQPRPAERNRANRAQANKGAQVNAGHLEEDDEPEMMQDPGSSLGHHGDRKKDASEETLRLLEESRHKDRQEFQKRSLEGDGSHSGKGHGHSAPPVALLNPPPSGTHLATPQANPQTGSHRALYGPSTSRGASGTQPSSGGSSPTGSRPALPSTTPLTGSRLALTAAAPTTGSRPALSPSAPPAVPSTGARPALPPKLDARHLLSTGKPVGTYLKEHPPASAGAPPAHQAAVQEAQERLANVKGIERIGTGQNQAGQTVLVVVAGRGFTYESLQAVPEKVRDLPTVVSISFPNLSLRRTAAPGAGLPPGSTVNKLGR
ncbi:hypothetical protein POL68_26415 [Stigmatella sp. ncwal1]|uniref:Uncharacterized protein n=1 Tax=Stigmatella ashevillensis TaxID=2995309 RepID=A0ABT5DEC1_9BACT|nr:hypothetical protein [Stigmatella ashevillena]MDC0712030.1 hypothetical protein [Stigmatella ashevillena]